MTRLGTFEGTAGIPAIAWDAPTPRKNHESSPGPTRAKGRTRAPSSTLPRASAGLLVCGVRPNEKDTHTTREQKIKGLRGEPKPQTHPKTQKKERPSVRESDESQDRGRKQFPGKDHKSKENKKQWPRWTQKTCETVHLIEMRVCVCVCVCVLLSPGLCLFKFQEREGGEGARLGEQRGMSIRGLLYTVRAQPLPASCDSSCRPIIS